LALSNAFLLRRFFGLLGLVPLGDQTDRAFTMRTLVLSCCFFALVLTGQVANAGTVLIKPEEAALPPAPSAPSIALTSRGITRRPNIILTSPEASVVSPFNLNFKFQAHGGSTIKPESFHMIYLKKPNVDLTSRVMPFVTAQGVNMVGAEAPPGRHSIKVMISDSADRKTSFDFVLNVLK
jgi:hypothetical protein